MPPFPSVEVALDALQARAADLERQLADRSAELAEVRRVVGVEKTIERVRADALAIRHSDETLGVAVAIFDALRELGVPVLQIELGGPADSETREGAVWTAGVDAAGAPRAARSVAVLDGHPALEAAYAAGASGTSALHTMDRAAFETYLRASVARYPASYVERVVARAPAAASVHVLSVPAADEGGRLTAVLSEAPSDDARRLLERFAALFGVAHARRKGVQRAEAQARAAQVEAALERVRARALAMQHSHELGAVVGAVFEALGDLGVAVHRSALCVVRDASRAVTFWSATQDGTLSGDARLEGLPLYEALFGAWRQQRDVSYILQDADLRAYYAALGSTHAAVLDAHVGAAGVDAEREYVHAVAIPAGLLVAFADAPFSEDTVQTMQRLARAFQIAYTRFQDLQQAEAQAGEAAQQASLDRVRAEIASMRTTSDLDRITPVMWEELTVLGVPFVGCGVFIVDEDASSVQAFLATQDGEPLGQLRLPVETHPLLGRLVDHWHRGEALSHRWDPADRAAWAEVIEAHGIDRAPGTDALALHFAPFAQGMLYVGVPSPLSAEDSAAVQALADAFEVAYARYDDFRQLDVRKRELETALAELRAAQTQLVQSEKLASLGALTAGIAHEIKNPLNFVNNFASLMRELAAELADELDGDPDPALVQELLHDLQANAERIEGHGRRADSIVRSMMQHARGGKGTREPGDVNSLVDENVSLAFHGRRAQVPDFNVTLERDYDPEVGRVEMVAQEIGRVLINLVNNAFDAVSDRAAAEGAAFTPVVGVRTARVDDGVEIRVHDNGGGIPEAVCARIFEPFFTTKPAGRGTGLGLSMSHDIVEQGHGGSLRVESEPGHGTTFVIWLPRERSPSAFPSRPTPAAAT